MTDPAPSALAFDLPALLRAIAKADRTTYAPGESREWDRLPPPDGLPRWSTPRELACAALAALHRRGIVSAKDANWRAGEVGDPVEPVQSAPVTAADLAPGARSSEQQAIR